MATGNQFVFPDFVCEFCSFYYYLSIYMEWREHIAICNFWYHNKFVPMMHIAQFGWRCSSAVREVIYMYFLSAYLSASGRCMYIILYHDRLNGDCKNGYCKWLLMSILFEFVNGNYFSWSTLYSWNLFWLTLIRNLLVSDAYRICNNSSENGWLF